MACKKLIEKINLQETTFSLLGPDKTPKTRGKWVEILIKLHLLWLVRSNNLPLISSQGLWLATQRWSDVCMWQGDINCTLGILKCMITTYIRDPCQGSTIQGECNDWLHNLLFCNQLTGRWAVPHIPFTQVIYKHDRVKIIELFQIEFYRICRICKILFQ